MLLVLGHGVILLNIEVPRRKRRGQPDAGTVSFLANTLPGLRDGLVKLDLELAVLSFERRGLRQAELVLQAGLVILTGLDLALLLVPAVLEPLVQNKLLIHPHSILHHFQLLKIEHIYH